MAKWRMMAYDKFGFEPGRYSQAHGKVALFNDLLAVAKSAAEAGNDDFVDRAFEYALWADRQTDEGLRSAADIEFFMPMFDDKQFLREAEARLPAEVLEAKRALVQGAH